MFVVRGKIVVHYFVVGLLLGMFVAMSASRAAAKDEAYFVRIYPAREHFLSTMTQAEGAAMRAHFLYWKARMAERKLILAGPIPIEPGTFGILILRTTDKSEAEDLMRHDPSVMQNVMKFEVYPLNLALYEAAAESSAPRSP